MRVCRDSWDKGGGAGAQNYFMVDEMLNLYFGIGRFVLKSHRFITAVNLKGWEPPSSTPPPPRTSKRAVFFLQRLRGGGPCCFWLSVTPVVLLSWDSGDFHMIKNARVAELVARCSATGAHPEENGQESSLKPFDVDSRPRRRAPPPCIRFVHS